MEIKENSTKELILQEALKLFAINGYVATSMSDIAKELNISKAALYKHYSSKQEIFDSIVKRMDEMDRERMQKYQMPTGNFLNMAKEYANTPLQKIKLFSEVQFRHLTEEEFSCRFRRMLTLEQYRSKELGELYQNYFVIGPIEFMTQIFGKILLELGNKKVDPKQVALDFYGPIYLLISMYDKTCNKEDVFSMLDEHIERFAKMNFSDVE